jgi:two-component system OmpR family sensor kinase
LRRRLPGTPLRKPRFFASARTRIIASYVVLLLFSTVVAVALQREVLLSRAEERVDDALVQETEEFRRLADDGRDPRTGRPFGDDVKAIFDVFLARNVPAEGEAFYTFAGDKPYMESSFPGLGPQPLASIRGIAAAQQTRGGEIETAETRLRYLAVPVNVGGRVRGTFVVAVDLGSELDEIAGALRVTAGVSIAVLLLGSLLAWMVAGRVLAPLRLLAETARSISETDLTRRIPVQGRDEIADLAVRFNDMLDRLEDAFASQKSFISDAGHELRTPITIIRGHLELLGDDPAERRETVELVTDELDRMSRLVDDLLLLAKSQRPDFLQLEPIDLHVLTWELFAKASALAPREWRLEAATAVRITADRQRLTQAVMNLGQNAVHQTRKGDVIGLGASVAGGNVRLWVRDSGPGVPREEQARIFERFARSGNGRNGADGAGLGLAIVRVIAEAHGGRVEVDGGAEDGAIFTIVIPTEPPREVTSAWAES